MTDIKIESKLNDALSGGTLENALEFMKFLNANEIIQADQHAMHFKDECVCYIDTRKEHNSWVVWTEGDYSNEHESYPIDKNTKNIAWANVMKCGNCAGVDCSPGKTKTIFEKEFENVCNADNVNMTFMFTNPDAETLECVKKLVLMRKNIIEEAQK
jgi:hypothetical protein